MTIDSITPLDDIADDDSIDGRTLRRTRNRTAVIRALLELIQEGELQPGAAEIAERAGVSHRSIFRYFEDLDDLVRTAVDQALNDALAYAGIDQIAQGTLAERAHSLAVSRLRLYEQVDGAMQVVRMRSYSIPSIDREVAAVWEIFRIQIRDHFSIELAAVDAPASTYLIDAVLTLTSYDSCSTHQRLLGRSHEQIVESWTTAVVSLLNG